MEIEMPEPSVDRILTALKSKQGNAVLLAIVCFLAGLYAAPTPEKDKFCKEYIHEIEILQAQVADLTAENELLRQQLKDALDACDQRVRTELDLKEKECVERIGKHTENIKAQFIDFKCLNCKKLGKCK